MIYQYGMRKLENIRDVYNGSVNDVLICRSVGSPQEVYYTMLLVREHTVARRLLHILEHSVRTSVPDDGTFVGFFTAGEETCFLFEYNAERKLGDFFNSDDNKLFVCEEVAINLVLKCISSPLPFQLLYLILTQDNVHIKKNNEIYFTYHLNLELLDDNAGEKECVNACASIVKSVIESKDRKNVKSLILISRKMERDAYSAFPELYHDIRITSVPEKGKGAIAGLAAFGRRNKDRFFGFLLVVCIVVVIIALIILISQIFLDDIPFFRLFSNSFKKIGTEYLTR